MRGKEIIRGFTLVELLVTISILAILMTIAMITYQNVQKNARDGKRKSDISTIQSALQQYRADQGYYPTSIVFDAALTNPSGTKTYMSKVPKETQSGQPYAYAKYPAACIDTATDPTTYCTNYCLYATVENTSNASSTATSICAALSISATSRYQAQAP